MLSLLLLFSSCDINGNESEASNEDIQNPCVHLDDDNNGKCDSCTESVIVIIDFYAINDLHGKFKDTESNEGVDELTTFLKDRYSIDDNVVLLSSGDMWQGSSESNLTKGHIITEWMNHLDFSSMTLGNHEYDWGEEYIESNLNIADFPFLAINIYEKETNKQVDYCDSSVIIERDGIQIGIIGAIGDCYSSISGDKSQDFYIKTGNELSSLVKAESNRLRDLGVDFIVYSIHDGYTENKYYETNVSNNDIYYYYNTMLSDGYVDLVFEGHTHQSYVLVDEYGVYHLQNGGDNKGISHVEMSINSANGSYSISAAEFVSSSQYIKFPDDTIVSDLLEKYNEQIEKANVILGINDFTRYSYEIKKKVAELYFKAGVEKWENDYKIVLGGGFISTRSPYDISPGEVKYGDLQSVLPFDNQLVLCSIKGYDLKNKFFETENKNYYIYFEEYGSDVKSNIDSDAIYYIVTDTYTSSYKPNKLTIVDEYTPDIFARDLLAEFIKNGGWTSDY